MTNSHGQVTLGLTKAEVLALLDAIEGQHTDHMDEGHHAVRDKLHKRLTRANFRLKVPSWWKHDNDWGRAL